MIPNYKIFGIIDLFYAFHALAFICLFAYVIMMCKSHKISIFKAVLSVIIIYSSAYALMLFLYWVESGFKNFGGQNIVRIFVYVPLIVWVTSKILKINFVELCSLIAPCLTINHGVAHLACIFAGCCHGFPSAIGIYNAIIGEKLFPIQIIEALIAIFITVYIVLYTKKSEANKVYAYPIMLILFGSTRFICEFMRDNEKIFLGCSSLSFHALFMAIVGAIWILFIKFKKKSSQIVVE